MPGRHLDTSRRVRPRRRVALQNGDRPVPHRVGAALAALFPLIMAVAFTFGLTSCATSATLSRLRESSPVVRQCEQVREEVAQDQGAGMVKRSGCPVCQW